MRRRRCYKLAWGGIYCRYTNRNNKTSVHIETVLGVMYSSNLGKEEMCEWVDSHFALNHKERFGTPFKVLQFAIVDEDQSKQAIVKIELRLLHKSLILVLVTFKNLMEMASY
jgi:hypothetical protein